MHKYFKIIVILCLVSSLGRFVLDSYLPSLPAIGQAFGLSNAYTQYTLTFYLLGFSFSQLIYGPLSDYYGRRKILVIGLYIFIFGNIICTIASSLKVLLTARLVAGSGAGACGVLNRAIASDCFKGAEFSKAWSYTTTTLVITLCVAPILGGYIQQLTGWRANFLISTVYIIIVLGIILKFLPETRILATKDENKNYSINIYQVLNNYYSILSTKSFLSGAFCYTLAFSGLIAYFQISPLLLIDEMGLSPSQYGWCSLLIASTYLIGGTIVGRYATRMGIRQLLIIGTLLLISGGLLMLVAFVLDYKGLTVILLPSCFYILGARIVIPNAIASSMEDLRHLGGSSSAMIGCIQMLGSSLISYGIANINNGLTITLALIFISLGTITLILCLSNKS